MTIQGALCSLNTLYEDDDIPVYYKPSIKKIIETVEMECGQKTSYWKCFEHNAYHGVDDEGEPIWRPVKVYHCASCNRRTVVREKFCPNCGKLMLDESK